MLPICRPGHGSRTGVSDCAEDRDPGAGRRRRAGRLDARDGPGLARDRRHDRGAATPRRAAEREVQPRVGPLDGDLPPARRGTGGARGRPAAGLPQRRGLPDHCDRDRARPHPHPVPGGALRRHRRTGHLVAHAGAAAPHQPDLPRADPLRARRRHAGPRRAEPHQGVGLGPAPTAGSSPRPTTWTPANNSRSPAPTSSDATAADRGSAARSGRRCTATRSCSACSPP